MCHSYFFFFIFNVFYTCIVYIAMANNQRVNMAFIIQNHKNCDRHRNFAYATHTRMKVCLAVCMTRLKTHLIQILWVFNCSQIIDYNNNEQLIPLILLLHHDCIVLKHYTKMQDIVYRHPVYTLHIALF